MIEFNSVMQRIYNQMKAIEEENRTPYYLCISNDVYEVLKVELAKSVMKSKYLKDGQMVVDIFEDMECVVYGHDSVNDYINIVGIKSQNAET
jgi:stalled ribosome rescue protein Dom34